MGRAGGLHRRLRTRRTAAGHSARLVPQRRRDRAHSALARDRRARRGFSNLLRHAPADAADRWALHRGRRDGVRATHRPAALRGDAVVDAGARSMATAPSRRRRPVLVWVVFLWYVFSAGYTLLSFALI